MYFNFLFISLPLLLLIFYSNIVFRGRSSSPRLHHCGCQLPTRTANRFVYCCFEMNRFTIDFGPCTVSTWATRITPTRAKFNFIWIHCCSCWCSFVHFILFPDRESHLCVCGIQRICEKVSLTPGKYNISIQILNGFVTATPSLALAVLPAAFFVPPAHFLASATFSHRFWSIDGSLRRSE